MNKMSDFKYTKLQLKILQDVENGYTNKYREICLNGGRRSGKTFLIMSLLIRRCLIAPYSSHVIVRRTRKSLFDSIWQQTIEQQMKTYDCYLSKSFNTLF